MLLQPYPNPVPHKNLQVKVQPRDSLPGRDGLFDTKATSTVEVMYLPITKAYQLLIQLVCMASLLRGSPSPLRLKGGSKSHALIQLTLAGRKDKL